MSSQDKAAFPRSIQPKRIVRQPWYSLVVPDFSRRAAWLAIAIVMAISLLDLVGWALDITLLKSVRPQWITMRVITALCLACSASALALLQTRSSSRWRFSVSGALGIAVILTGLLTVVVYATEMSSGHDAVAVHAPLLGLFLAPATRMALVTAILFVVVGCVLVLLSTGSRRAAGIAHALALPGAAASYLVPVSYLLGVQAMHDWLGLPVALNTGVAFCALCVAIFCVRPDTWMMSVFAGNHAGGVMARRLLPGLMFIPLVIGWLRLYGERSGAFASEVGVVLVAVAYTVCLVLLMWLSAKSVNRTGEALRESEQRLRGLYASMTEGVALHTMVYDDSGAPLDYRIHEVNPAFESITNISSQQAQGSLASELYGTGTPPYLDLYGKVAATGEPTAFETYFPPMEKNFHVSVFSPAKGTFATVFSDITERKRAEEAMRQSEERFDLATKAAQEGIWDWNMETDAVYYSPRYKQMVGYTEDEIEPHVSAWKRLLHPEDRERVYQAVDAVLRGEREYEIEFRLRHKDGHYLDILSRGFPVRREPGGAIVRIVGTHFDLTERKRAEEALKASEERYRGLFQNMLEGFAYCKMVFENETPQDFIYLSVNHAFETLTGLTNVAGKRVTEVIPGIRGASPELFEIYGRVSLTGKRERFETFVEPLNTWFSVSVYSPEREFFVAVFDVITERKRAEEQLRKARDELEIRVQERTKELEILSSRLVTAQEEERKRIAHDVHDGLGQMLSAIKFKMEEVVHKEGNNTANIVKNMTEVLVPMFQESVEEVRRIQMDLRPAILDDIGIIATIGWFCRNFRSLYSGIEVEPEIEIEEARVPVGLKTAIYRIVQEAMNNISKHSKADHVHLSLRGSDGKIELTIQDNGQGFDHKGVGITERQEGGLGLSSMKQRAQLSGGAFSLSSAKGQGTTIRASWAYPDPESI